MEPHDGILAADLACPVCNARQPWSDACRRCKSDLVLLRRVAEAGRRQRCRVVAHLAAGRWAEAAREAEQHYALYPGADAGRLLAVCHFLDGNWPAAVGLMRHCWASTPTGGLRGPG